MDTNNFLVVLNDVTIRIHSRKNIIAIVTYSQAEPQRSQLKQNIAQAVASHGQRICDQHNCTVPAFTYKMATSLHTTNLYPHSFSKSAASL